MRAYLDYAGIGRVRRPAVVAMRAALDEVLPHGAAEIRRLFTSWTAARETAARLLECEPDEIAMVPNTSSGLHLVADGLAWRPGDEVIVFDRDFPANVHPWRRLTGRGVRLRWVPMRDGGYDLADVADVAGPATRLIAASHVNFRTGFRLDLDALCQLAAGCGALVCVDAVQSLGTRPLSLSRTRIDFLVAGGHKTSGCAPRRAPACSSAGVTGWWSCPGGRAVGSAMQAHRTCWSRAPGSSPTSCHCVLRRAGSRVACRTCWGWSGSLPPWPTWKQPDWTRSPTASVR
jgi:kynureninase